LVQPALSRYGTLRKARLPTQLSTLEATCAALADIEAAPTRYAPLVTAFGRFVDDRAGRVRRAQ
jgi:DTW domain-containing protein YfiP